MKKVLTDLFSQNSDSKPLFIFEMANNHMGDVNHGLRIIKEFFKVSKNFNFIFAFKLQMRDIDTFIHPDYRKRMDIPYIKRFSETRLTPGEFKRLKNEIEKLGFISICTPFDEKSVDLIEKLQFDIIKIGSCSFTDWPLLEKIVQTDKPIIASTAGVSLSEIDSVTSFFQHRGKRFALMHCVGEYPTKNENLQLNQIDLLKYRYHGVPVGFSTHEDPENFIPVQLAIAKGARIFERHVGIKTEKFGLNAYSSTPEQIHKWLISAKQALTVCGTVGSRAKFGKKELADLRQFKRGVYAVKTIKKGNRIDKDNIFLAFPNLPNQLLANDLSKYISYIAKQDVHSGQPVLYANIERIDTRKKIYAIVIAVRKLLKESGIIVPNQVNLEISHHYGIDNFYKYGSVMFTIVNREYCKKLIIMLPHQKHPVQYHKKKEESFNVLYGDFNVYLDGGEKTCKPGDVVTIGRNVKHSFLSKTGGILEEISSTHYTEDSYYEDEAIKKNKNRKTLITYWSE